MTCFIAEDKQGNQILLWLFLNRLPGFAKDRDSIQQEELLFYAYVLLSANQFGPLDLSHHRLRAGNAKRMAGSRVPGDHRTSEPAHSDLVCPMVLG
ncbi:hypothetical protein ANRL3_01077 [Anaerolineae bacterium]|nr:hypothetical protein ANRL3_01077 [Anaerolineae bacterium]